MRHITKVPFNAKLCVYIYPMDFKQTLKQTNLLDFGGLLHCVE